MIVDDTEIRTGELGPGHADVAGEIATAAIGSVRAVRIVRARDHARLEIATASATMLLARGDLASLRWVATRLLEHAGSANGPLAFAREAARCCGCGAATVVLARHRPGWTCTACGKTCVREHRPLVEAA